MLKKLTLSAAILAASFTFSQAADDFAPIDSARFDWSGFYVGGHVGHLEANVDTDAGPGIPTSYDANGYLGGALIGFNYQVDNIVWGIEGDISFGDLSGSAINGRANPTSNDLDMAGSIRGRLGVALENDLMLFVTGGFAFADTTFSDPNQTAPNVDDQRHTGYVIGGGLEWMALENVSIRGEYLYTNYGSEFYQISPNPDPIEFNTHVLRGAIILHY